MLDLVSAERMQRDLAETGAPVFLYWFDNQRHRTALHAGGASEEIIDNTFMHISGMGGHSLATRSFRSEEAFGFSLHNVHQVLSESGNLWLSGGLDTSGLPAAWDSFGYERHDTEAGTVWLDPVDEQPGFAVVDDETVLMQSYVFNADEMTEPLLFAKDGSGKSSAATIPELTALIETLPDDAAHALPWLGEGLEARNVAQQPDPDDDVENRLVGPDAVMEESEAAVGPMPEIRMALFGFSAGLNGPVDFDDFHREQSPVDPADPVGRFFVHLLTSSPEDAQRASEVVAWRVEHLESSFIDRPYAEFMVPVAIGDDRVQGDVATLGFSLVHPGLPWHTLLWSFDLWPFAWVDEESTAT